MNILVTGRDGQLGSELQVLSDNSKHSFVFVGSKDGDITDKSVLQAIIEKHAINLIINCAAYTAVDRAEQERDLAFKVNEFGVRNLVELCEQFSMKLIHISTDYVFPGNGEQPYKPGDSVAPLGVYGASKLAGEKAIKAASIDAVIIRTSWVYSTFGKNFVKTMLRLGSERDTINVVNDQRGCPTYAKDLALACLVIVDASWKGTTVYHFSNLGEITWFDFATTIMEITKSPCSVHPIPSSEFPTPAQRPTYSVMDTSDIQNDFGLEIRHWRTALQECLSQIDP